MATAKDKEFAKVMVFLGFLKQENVNQLWKQYEQLSYYKQSLTFPQWLVQNTFLTLAQVAAVEHHFIKENDLNSENDFDSDSREIDIAIQSALNDEDYYDENKDKTIDDVNLGLLPKSAIGTVYDEASSDSSIFPTPHEPSSFLDNVEANIPQTLFEGNYQSKDQIPQTLFEGNIEKHLPNSNPKIQHDSFFDASFPTPDQESELFPKTKLEGPKNNFDSVEIALLQSQFAGELGEESSQIKPGKKFGQYDVIGEIGRGGMGKVYKVYDSNRKQVLALKVLLSTGEKENDKMGRFLREAFLSSKFNHPNIVAAHDIGDEEGQVFFTMDFIQGKTLDELLKEKSFSRRQIIEMMIKITDAISHAHSKKIIHRDLKPGNIIITNNNEPKIMDFGLAKIINEDSKLSKSGMIIGTVHYMPPEQADGLVKELDERSDTYALGAILYELITGCTPFKGSSFSEIIDQILYEEPIIPSKIKRVHRDLEKICLKAIEKEKEDRYQTANDFMLDLKLFIKGQKINIKSSFWPKTMRKIKRNISDRKTKYILAFASLFLICLFLVMSVFQKKEILLAKEINFTLVDKKEDVLKKILPGESIYLLVKWPSGKKINKNLIYLQVHGNAIVSNQHTYAEEKLVDKLLIDISLLTESSGTYKITSQIKIGDLEKKSQLLFEIKQPSKLLIKPEEKIEHVMFRGDLKRTGQVNNNKPYNHKYTKTYRTRIGTKFFAAPIVLGNTIYAASLNGTIYALDYEKNKLRWSFQAPKINKRNAIVSSPTIAGKYIYFGSENGYLYALNKNSGELKWQFHTAGIIQNSPLIKNGQCYFGSSDNKLYNLNRFNGELNWNFRADGQILSSVAYADNTIYFGDHSPHFYAIDARDGNLIWKQQLLQKVTSTPSIVEDYVYFSCIEGNILALKCRDGAIKWRHETGEKIIFSSPTIVNNHLYCGSYAGIHIINIYSGKQVLFKKTKGKVYSSPVYNKKGIVYFTNNRANVFIINSHNLKFKSLLLQKLKENISFIIRGQNLFFTSMSGNVFILK